MGDRSFKGCFRLGLLFLGVFAGLVAAEKLDEKMKTDTDISQFYSLLEQSKVANFTLQYKQVTVFAPINAAFQKIGSIGEDTEALVLYHMASIPKRTDQLGSSYTSLYSEFFGNPPLWITHITGIYHDDIYVNNARILVSQSNIQNTGRDQVLHKIDEVLVPTTSPKTAANKIFNPTAWEFLENYESLIQHPYRVRNFRQKVQQNNKQSIFNTEGGHTFFIPVDEGFGNERAASIDDKIIDGHVIPQQVLFTTPTKKDVPFQTLASGDNVIRVLISFTQEKRGPIVLNYVKSHTLLGEGKHTPGVVLVEIAKPNIPVKNGVIHLIHKPLMVVDSTVRQLLEANMDYICSVGNAEREKPTEDPRDSKNPEYDSLNTQDKDEGGILNNFIGAISNMGKVGQDFLKKLDGSRGVTLFAPCNQAFESDMKLDSIIQDKARFMEIANMHLVPDERIYVDDIVNKNGQYKARTMNPGKELYFNVWNRTMTVEGGGVNATVLQSDLAAVNGVIHIIDRVLGVPYTTVLDKLRTDPILKSSYMLGNLRGFNSQLNDTTKKFTYFVPRDKAWLDAKVKLPSAIKKLFMSDYSYLANPVLERHLVISDVPYTMERIKQLTNETDYFIKRPEAQLPAVRGSLELYVIEDHGTFTIVWNREKIPVFKPNVECTNGIIHVIDAPFLQEGDIRVSSAPITAIAPQILMILVAKILLL